METWSAPSFSQPFKTYLKKSRPTGHPNILCKQVLSGRFKNIFGFVYLKRCFAILLMPQELRVNPGALPNTKCRAHMHILWCTGWCETGLCWVSFTSPPSCLCFHMRKTASLDRCTRPNLQLKSPYSDKIWYYKIFWTYLLVCFWKM